MSSRPRTTNPWLEFQREHISANDLPPALRAKFWQSPLDYRDRLYFAAHGFLNLLSPNVILTVLKFVNPNYTEARATEIRQVYEHLHNLPTTEQYCNYFAFSFVERRVVCLNRHLPGNPTCLRTHR